jgi:hypothetical protein
VVELHCEVTIGYNPRCGEIASTLALSFAFFFTFIAWHSAQNLACVPAGGRGLACSALYSARAPSLSASDSPRCFRCTGLSAAAAREGLRCAEPRAPLRSSLDYPPGVHGVASGGRVCQIQVPISTERAQRYTRPQLSLRALRRTSALHDRPARWPGTTALAIVYSLLGPGRKWRLSALSVSHSKSVPCGASFMGTRGA